MASRIRKAGSWVSSIVISCLVSSACTYTVVPDSIPAVEGSQDVTFAGSTLAVVCAETDDKEFVIYSSSRHGTFQGNRKAWCEKLAVALSDELTRRGAVAKADSANRVSVTLPEITGRSGYATVGFAVKALVTTPSGFRKNYEAQGSAAMGWSMGGIGDRSASFVMAELVKAMLADAEFVAAVKAMK
jgi:hypothetical protein